MTIGGESSLQRGHRTGNEGRERESEKRKGRGRGGTSSTAPGKGLEGQSVKEDARALFVRSFVSVKGMSKRNVNLSIRYKRGEGEGERGRHSSTMLDWFSETGRLRR